MRPEQIAEIAKRKLPKRKQLRITSWIATPLFFLILFLIDFFTGGAIKHSSSLTTFIFGFFVVFITISFFIINVIPDDVGKYLFKIPKLFCPHCREYIDESLSWGCPYCHDRNASSFYLPCKNCHTRIGIILCPFCQKTFYIDRKIIGNKAIIIHKTLLTKIADIVDKTIDSYDSTEAMSEDVKKAKDFFSVVRGEVDKDDLDIERLRKQRLKLLEQKEIETLQGLREKPEKKSDEDKLAEKARKVKYAVRERIVETEAAYAAKEEAIKRHQEKIDQLRQNPNLSDEEKEEKIHDLERLILNIKGRT